MTPTEAADLIESMVASLKTNPGQFNIAVNVIGQQAISHGGIGMQVTAVGGGPGSTTIGNQVSMNGAQVQIAQQRGLQAMEQQFGALVETLQSIAAQLRSPTPDRSFIRKTMDSLKNTWVPGVILGCLATPCRSRSVSSPYRHRQTVAELIVPAVKPRGVGTWRLKEVQRVKERLAGEKRD
jgi:hypothetical protein